METVACNLCGSQDVAVLYELFDYLLERPEVHATLVQCRSCGLVYQNPRPTPQEIGAHYPPEYDLYDPGASHTPDNPLLQMVYDYGLRKRRRFLTRHIASGRILDLGCATGVFLSSLQRAAPGSWELHGIEINPGAAEIARQRPGLQILTGSLDQAPYPEAYFDAVTLWDVLEHVHDPLGELKQIHRLLKPGGVVLVRLPNLDSRAARLFGKHWGGLEPPRHLYVFNLQTLSRMWGAAGFEPVSASTGISAYLSYVQSLRFRMVERGVPVARRQRLLRLLNHPLARLLSAPLFFLDGLFLQGPSLVMVARKTVSDETTQVHAK